jgi:hypothetical protein
MEKRFSQHREMAAPMLYSVYAHPSKTVHSRRHFLTFRQGRNQWISSANPKSIVPMTHQHTLKPDQPYDRVDISSVSYPVASSGPWKRNNLPKFWIKSCPTHNPIGPYFCPTEVWCNIDKIPFAAILKTEDKESCLRLSSRGCHFMCARFLPFP